jgi:hypothetical protein
MFCSVHLIAFFLAAKCQGLVSPCTSYFDMTLIWIKMYVPFEFSVN